jgi:hypothetical protein
LFPGPSSCLTGMPPPLPLLRWKEMLTMPLATALPCLGRALAPCRARAREVGLRPPVRTCDCQCYQVGERGERELSTMADTKVGRLSKS